MIYGTFSLLLVGGLLLGMLLFLELGQRLGRKTLAKDKEANAGIGAVEGAVFGLLGLLIAFTFSGAAERLDARRHLITEEANAIGTAYLRVDLLAEKHQPAVREAFRRYLDARLAAYKKLPDIEAATLALEESNKIQKEVWDLTIAAAKQSSATPPLMLLVPALNAMIDITTTRKMATMVHPPIAIYGMLIGAALISSLLAGYGMAPGKTRRWLHKAGFVAVIALSTYIIIDLEFPRLGFIRVDNFDQVLVEVRRSMGD